MKKVLLVLTLFLGLSLALPGLAAPSKVKGVKVRNIKSNRGTVSWTAQSSASAYRIKVRTKSGKLFMSGNVTSNAAYMNGLKANRRYKVKVRAKDAYGKFGPWSKVKRFTTKSWRYYHNNRYGYNMKFPKGWKGMRVKTASGYDGVFVNYKLYSNSMSQRYTMFSIQVITQEQYALYGAGMGTYLGENDDYVFVYFHAQDTASDLYARARELDSIIDTFEMD